MLETSDAALSQLQAGETIKALTASLKELEACASPGRCGGIAREDVIAAAMEKKMNRPDLWVKEVGEIYGRVMVKSMRATPVRVSSGGRRLSAGDEGKSRESPDATATPPPSEPGRLLRSFSTGSSVTTPG